MGREHMEAAHVYILVGGLLGVLSIFAAIASRRLGAPVLLVFLLLGMLAGEDGPGGIPYDDFSSAYLIGSVALAVILFEGGLKTHLSMLRLALWPALALAVIGVAITALIIGATVMWIAAVPFSLAMLIGAAVAPTDAAAVGSMLGKARLSLPAAFSSPCLKSKSGLNDPMSIFLTVFVILVITEPANATWQSGLLLFAQEMFGGGALGLGGGWLLRFLLRQHVVRGAHRDGVGLSPLAWPCSVWRRCCTPAASWQFILPALSSAPRNIAAARRSPTSTRASPGWPTSCCS